jgi:hypothetical protein
MFLKGLPEGTKVVVFCESGLRRTAFMAAVYWIMKVLRRAMRLLASAGHAEPRTGLPRIDDGFSMNNRGWRKAENFDGSDFVFHAITWDCTGRRIGVPLSNLLYWPS